MSKRHEQLLFHYSSALERGDFQAVADVLREAERDPALEQMILDMNDAYAVERFNHTNPKENPMLAALYQNPYRTQRSRVHWQSLPFVAALAVIALLSVMLAVETRGSTPLNTGGDNSTTVARTSPYCSGTLVSSFSTLPLRSRPASDAPVVTDLVHERNAGREIVVQDRVSVDGEGWVFVRVPSSPDVPFGWIPEAEFSTMVADCQPLADGIVQRPLLVATVDLNATIIPPVITSTPLPAIAQQPLFVVTQPSADTLVTVIPANVMPLSTFTTTPELQSIEAAAFPPTVVPPSAAEYGVSIAATDLARFSAGGACKAITLTSAIVRASPEWDSTVITTLPEDTFVSVGDFVSSTDAQGNPLRWYVVGFQDIRGWMQASQLDTSACPLFHDTSADSPATELAATRLYMMATAMIQTATALPSTVVPPSDISDVAMPPQSMLERANFCTTTLRTATDVLSLPLLDGVIVGVLPPGTVVAVIDTQVFSDAQQTAVLWYFVAAREIQGWVSVYTLEAPVCPKTAGTVPPVLPTLMPPPILTATPVPVTFVPLITTTPPPTPTPVQ